MGLVASSLSFGRVSQIFKAIDFFLTLVDNKPLEYLRKLENKPDKRLFSLKYRFITGQDLHDLLCSAKAIIERYGSLGEFMREKYVRGGFLELAAATIKRFENVYYLMPSSLDSACKRLFMYFRWMVRKDEIDLGLWDFIDPRELVVPLDTHVFRISRQLGLTGKNTACLNTAIEITNNLRRYSQSDPVKYDWALSHMGIIKE